MNSWKRTFFRMPDAIRCPKTVPIFVPTPRIEALRTIASARARGTRNSLITRNIAQLLTTIVHSAKSMKNGRLLIRNQQVAGSTPAGGSRKVNPLAHARG
jgi:hypothetical protein